MIDINLAYPLLCYMLNQSKFWDLVLHHNMLSLTLDGWWLTELKITGTFLLFVRGEPGCRHPVLFHTIHFEFELNLSALCLLGVTSYDVSTWTGCNLILMSTLHMTLSNFVDTSSLSLLMVVRGGCATGNYHIPSQILKNPESQPFECLIWTHLARSTLR